MKRDMDLCRKILLQREEDTRRVAYDFAVDGYDKETIRYHCNLLKQAGFLSKLSTDLGNKLSVGELTWQGHEFLDSIREDTVWHKTKDVIAKKGLPMALDVVKEISQAVITSMVQGAIKGLSQ